MGTQGSRIQLKRIKLTNKLVSDLESSSHFSAQEIRILYNRFKDLIKSGKRKAGIKIPDFKLVLGVSSTKLTECIFAGFDRNGDKSIDFVEYISGVSALCDRAEVSEKAEFIFNVFDVGRKGKIKKSDFMEIMTLIIKERSGYISDDQVGVLVETSWKTLDSKDAGEIDFKQFQESISISPFLLGFATIDLKLLLSSTGK